MSVTVKLRSPITAHGETVSELVFREPRGKDIAACGMPRTFVIRSKSTVMEVDTASIHDYIVALAGIPPTSADQISASDWSDVTTAILGFFVPTDGAGDKPVGEKPAAPAPGVDLTGKILMPFQDSST